MNREREINALLVRAKSQFKEIRTEYDKSLHDQGVTDLLKIDIKNLCENLRSVLDYLAHTIRETHCPSANSRDRFYFPILPDATSFQSQANRWFPGLQQANQDMYNYLESVQPYQSGFEWLGKFNKMNNENKHGSLVEQTRMESVRITAKSQGGGLVSWNPSGVRFGSGVFINGVPVDPNTQMPIPSPTQTVTKTVWVDFLFDGINTSALQLKSQSLNGIESIANEVKKRI